MFIKKDVQYAPVTNTFNLSNTENYHHNTTRQPHPKTSLKGINGTHLPAARSQLTQTTPRYEANRKINVNDIDILNDTSNRSNNSFLEISSPADSTPLQSDTEIFSPRDIKLPQFRKKPGSPFITSLVKHNQTPEGRQAVKELGCGSFLTT